MPSKIYLSLFFILQLSLFSFGQVPIWSEGFEDYANYHYENGDDNRLPNGIDWTKSVTSSNYFGVYPSSSLTGNRLYLGSKINAYWLSETIDISSYTNISASVDYHEYGNLEGSDFIKIEYRLNGAAWEIFANGAHSNDMSGIETATITGLNGSNIQIRISVKNSSNDEYWMFDNIEIKGIPNPPDCNWSLCIVDFYGASNWNESNLKVNINGNQLGSTLSNIGNSTYCIDIPIYEGDDLFLDYTPGQLKYHNEYYLYDSFGNLVYSSGVNNTIPSNYTFNDLDCEPHPIEPTVQDCLGAISICGDSYSTTTAYSGTGNIPNEINPGPSCLNNGERNDVWYIFTVQQTGQLKFTITPNNLHDDYDWSVFNLTNASCDDIYSNPTLEVSCNYSGTRGVTGPDGSDTPSHQGAGGSAFNNSIPVVQNQIYAINVSNFTSSQSGYFIDFSMASGVIVDVTPPKLQTIVDSPTCGEDEITAWFTELVETNTVNADNFTVNGPGGPYSITNVLGTSNSENEREFKLSLDAQLIAGGTYSLVFSGQVNDACGNIVEGNSLDFTVAGVTGNTSVNDGSVLCYNNAVGSITASANGGSNNYSYLWNTGATTSTINNLAVGNYTVTINDDVGVCYDIVTARVEASNPSTATGVWAGTKNTNWYDCENWGGGRVPTAFLPVTIPDECPNYPIFTDDKTFTNIAASDNVLCQSIRILNGGNITFTDEKNLTIRNIVIEIGSGGSINANGDLSIKSGANLVLTGGTVTTAGDFKNNGVFTSYSGEVTFNGTSIQQIKSSSPITFNNLTINNPYGVLLVKDIGVNGNLTLTNGKLNISDKEIDFGTTGALVGETESNQVANFDGGGFPIRGLGTLKATRTNPSGNVAGLGLNINPSSPLGNTTITRGLDTIHGTGSFTGNSSISRYFIIESNNRASITMDVIMSYFGSDLVSHMNGTLIMFQEVKYGSGPAYLKPLSTINTVSTNTAVATTVNNNLSSIKLTLGSSAIPLPVSLIDFTVNCEGEGVILEWQTASEVNNAYFNIEKSVDGIHYEEIDEIEGHGNSNIMLSYQSKDRLGTTENTYYRLKQTDFDGTFKYIGTKVLNCDVKEINSSSINLHPNPVKKGKPIYVTIDDLNEEVEIKISIINILSQTAFEGFILTDYKGELIINSNISETLAKGHYIINGTYDNKSFQKKLIIN